MSDIRELTPAPQQVAELLTLAGELGAEDPFAAARSAIEKTRIAARQENRETTDGEAYFDAQIIELDRLERLAAVAADCEPTGTAHMVVAGEYADTLVLGVFERFEVAEAFADKRNAAVRHTCDRARVEEVPFRPA